jgi:hypothetical protein
MEFEEIKKRLKTECFTKSSETNHQNADDILREIALDTSLTREQREKLVEIYDRVGKWFA